MVRSVQFLSVGLFLSAGIRPTTGVQLVVRRHRVFWDAAVAAEFEPSADGPSRPLHGEFREYGVGKLFCCQVRLAALKSAYDLRDLVQAEDLDRGKSPSSLRRELPGVSLLITQWQVRLSSSLR